MPINNNTRFSLNKRFKENAKIKKPTIYIRLEDLHLRQQNIYFDGALADQVTLCRGNSVRELISRAVSAKIVPKNTIWEVCVWNYGSLYLVAKC